MQGTVVAVVIALLFVAMVCHETNAFLSGISPIVHQSQSGLRLAAFDPKKEIQKFVPPSIIGEEIPLTSDFTELPNTFQDAVGRAVERSISAIKSGKMRVRVDFDTSIGDMTYTSLKNSLPMMKEFAIGLTRAMELTMSIDIPDAITNKDTATASTTKPSINNSPESERLATMRIFFPDMGAAALARRDWKLGTEVAEVPPSVRTANMQNDPIDSTSDKVAVVLCPQSSESDYVKIIMESCTEANIPCILINPNLINMDQGYGVRARNLRKDVLDTFITSYKLKTMKYGALVREWPKGFSVWNQDETSDDGYRLLVTYAREPSNELLLDIYDVANPDIDNPNKEGPNVAVKVIGEVMGFFKGLQKL